MHGTSLAYPAFMTSLQAIAGGARCRCCGVSSPLGSAGIVDRVPFQDEQGPAELLFHFCEPCVVGFGDEQARRAYVIGLLVS
jgi:hypothetical protein